MFDRIGEGGHLGGLGGLGGLGRNILGAAQ